MTFYTIVSRLEIFEATIRKGKRARSIRKWKRAPSNNWQFMFNVACICVLFANVCFINQDFHIHSDSIEVRYFKSGA